MAPLRPSVSAVSRKALEYYAGDKSGDSNDAQSCLYALHIGGSQARRGSRIFVTGICLEGYDVMG
jgi:hypothetical protein